MKYERRELSEKEKDFGRLLKKHRLSLSLKSLEEGGDEITQEEMGKRCKLSRSTIGKCEAGYFPPKRGRKTILALAKGYELSQEETQTILEYYKYEPLSEKESSELPTHLSESPLSANLTVSTLEYLSKELRAKAIKRDWQDKTRWVYEPQETSGILVHLENDYQIDTSGLYKQELRAEIFQLTKRQGVLTPLYVARRDKISQNLQIRWNGEKVSADAQLFSSLDFLPSLDILGVSALSYKITLSDVEINRINTLSIKAQSHLLLCDLKGGYFAFCLPYFYAIKQNPEDFRITLPKEGIEDVSIFALIRKIDSNDPLDWEDPHPLTPALMSRKNSYHINIWIPPTLSPNSSAPCVIKKRYCPDLIIIKFRVTRRILGLAIKMLSEKRRPLWIDEGEKRALTFFCGLENCPAAFPSRF